MCIRFTEYAVNVNTVLYSGVQRSLIISVGIDHYDRKKERDRTPYHDNLTPATVVTWINEVVVNDIVLCANDTIIIRRKR